MSKKLFLILSVLFSALMVSCSFFTPSERTSIVVNLSGSSSRAAAPEYLSYYEVTAASESLGYTQTQSTKNTSSETVEFADLEEGEYTVTVKAYKEDDSCFAEGTDTVVVKSGETAQAKVTLKVPADKVTQIVITGSTTVYGGSEVELTAEVTPSDASDTSVTWSSSDTSVVTVDSNGKVTGVSYGTVTITAAANDGSGVTGTLEVTVPSVTITYSTQYSSLITATVSRTLTASGYELTALDLLELTYDGYDFIGWYTDSTYTTKVSSGDLITSDTTLYAKWTEIPEITVPVTSITVTAENNTVYGGQTVACTAAVLPSDATYTGVNWSSSDPSIAAVDSDGKVTGVSYGTVTITAAAADGSGVTGSVTVTVPSFVINYSSSFVTQETAIRTMTAEDYTLTSNDLPELTYENYYFAGWYSDSEFATEVSAGDIISVSSASITLYAKWESYADLELHANYPAIRALYSDDSETIYYCYDAIPYKAGSLVFIADTTSDVDSYSWKLNGNSMDETTKNLTINPYASTYLNITGTNVVTCTVTSGSVTKSASFTFTLTDTGYVTISYSSSYDQPDNIVVIMSGDSYSITEAELPELSDDNYSFCGWYTDDTYSTMVEIGYTITGDTTFYAKWQESGSATTTALTVNINAWYSSESSTIYSTGAEIPYENGTLLITAAVSTTGCSYEWTINGTTISESDVGLSLGSGTIEINPYLYTGFVTSGTNLITCVVTKDSVTKSASFTFTFTDDTDSEESTDSTVIVE